MAADNIRIFLQRVAEDAALQEQIKALAGQDAARLEESVLKLAAAQGLPFTAEELQAFATEEARAANERGDLSDSELEQVAGGGLGKMLLISFTTGLVGCGAAFVISVGMNTNKVYSCDISVGW